MGILWSWIMLCENRILPGSIAFDASDSHDIRSVFYMEQVGSTAISGPIIGMVIVVEPSFDSSAASVLSHGGYSSHRIP
jgi:hypothetical protein